MQYLVRGARQTLFFTAQQAVLSLGGPETVTSGRMRHVQSGTQKKVAIRMGLRNSRQPDSIEALDPLPGKVNYFLGNDHTKWQTDIPTYGRIAYHGVYPGIDLVYYGTAGSLEYDFVARAGADTSAIQVQFEGADRVRVDENGDLVLDSAAGAVRWKKPYVYQEVNGVRRQIAAGYRLTNRNTVTFALARYDRKRPLVIDPVLVYSTFLGGSAQEVFGTNSAYVDSTGIYAAGFSYSTNFPVTAGAWDVTLHGIYDVTITKLNPQGSAVLYSTYLGGTQENGVNGYLVGSDGSVYLSGFTNSPNFPITAGVVQTFYTFGNEMGFVTHLSPTFNSLMFSTYIGGSTDDDIFSIALDAGGNIYVAGITRSYNLPVTQGAAFPSFTGFNNEAFVTKLNPTATARLYSTYLGGSGDEEVQNPNLGQIPPQVVFDYANHIAVDAAGNAYVAGVTTSCDFPTTTNAYQRTSNCDGFGDGYIVKLNTTGTGLVYSTLLGGSGFDAVGNIKVDSTGSALVAGVTNSANFPTTAGAFSRTYNGASSEEGFAARLGPTGSTLTYSTYFGGSVQESYVVGDLASNGDVLLSGQTYSNNLPTTAGTFQPAYGGNGDSFLAVMDPTLSRLIDCTYVGGPNGDIAMAAYGTDPSDILMLGSTASSTFPTTAGAYQRTFSGGGSDLFLARFTVSLPASPVLSISKSHSGNFAQGQTGATYTVTVSNSATGAATSGTVTVTETVPSGETLTGMSGSGWSCSANTCTRGDSLAVGSSYPSITVTVNVASSANSPQTNQVSVAGGGSSGASATDPTTITGPAVLSVVKSHSGNFTIGQQSATYTVTVTDSGSIGTSGTVTVSENLPSGLTLVSMTGSGWTCPGSNCTRSDSLGVGQSYPSITVTVNVSATAATPQINSVTASGGGAASASATDSTVIVGATTSSGLAFYPVTPCRVVDTRTANGPYGGPMMAAGSTRVFAIASSTACPIPANAQAYSLNITIVPPGPLGYLTAWPTGQAQPLVSTLNSNNGAILANAAIVPAGTGGQISIFVSDATQVIVDINGYFAPQGGSGALAFYPVTPCRVADTRNPNGLFGGPSLAAAGTRSFAVPQSGCNIPSTAQAYSLNMTVVPPGPLTYLTTWPTGQAQPNASTLNALQGQIAANAAIVPAGTSGAISVFASDATNVIVDINGYFAPSGSAGALYFYPVTPCRIADSRNGNGTFGGPLLGAGSTRVYPIPSSSCQLPATAQAWSLNMTVVPITQLFYLSVWPAGLSQPVVSTLNDQQGQVVANAAIVPAGSNPVGGIAVYVSDATQLIVDANGYFGQ